MPPGTTTKASIQDKVMQAREESLMLEGLFDERINLLLEREIHPNADGAVCPQEH